MNDTKPPRGFAASDISIDSILPAKQTTLLAQVTDRCLPTPTVVHNWYNHNDYCSSLDYVPIKYALTVIFGEKIILVLKDSLKERVFSTKANK